ncbi:MAG: BrnT family toxin [Candidatus Omnitrophica bacterium]|nr:BrnT family toxin [Candidatus Omnitrophota bacterium]
MSNIKFEWDKKKEYSNQKKHGVSFDEAQSIFYDEYALEFHDEAHSLKEERFLMLGISYKLHVLVACYCIREKGNVIRIISARKATKKEQKYYWEERP